MRVINETKWRTDELKKLAMEVAYRESSLTTEGRKNLKITFGYRGTKVWRGSPNRPGSVRIKLPRGESFLIWKERISLAQTLTWAIGVAIGLRRREMAGLTKYTLGLSIEYEPNWLWVEKFNVNGKTVIARPEKFFQQKAVDSARMSVADWERKLKLAMTKLAMWKRELKKREDKLGCLEADSPVELSPLVSGRKFRKPPEVNV